MKFEAATLPDSPDSLKEIILDLQDRIEGLETSHQKETSILYEQLRLLRAKLFGRKSEKIPPNSTV